jgi:hypothetical protein
MNDKKNIQTKKSVTGEKPKFINSWTSVSFPIGLWGTCRPRNSTEAAYRFTKEDATPNIYSPKISYFQCLISKPGQMVDNILAEAHYVPVEAHS